MRSIIYDPGDLPLVTALGHLAHHIANGCPGCVAYYETPKGRSAVADGVAYLTERTSEPLSADDLPALLDFCTAWMDVHTLLDGIDTLTKPIDEEHDYHVQTRH